MNSYQWLYAASILLTGLLAGLFYGFQCSIINGLGALGNREYLLGFQSINKAILNPVFFLSFMGSLIVLTITCYAAYKSGANHLLPYLLLSTAVYAFAVFGITVVCNVPLNEQLMAFDMMSATDSQMEAMRQRYENIWNYWHLIRTVAAVVAFGILVFPLVKKM
jgi:uncharacterized membrane protein